MTEEQIIQKIANMELELSLLKAQLNRPKHTINYWHPENNDVYFYVDTSGEIRDNRHYSTSSNKRYRVFKTNEEAKKYADYVKAEETLRKAIAEANNGWLPNWDAKNTYSNFCIMFSNSEPGYIYTDSYYATKIYPNFMYIKSKELASKLIKYYEKEFITYLTY